MINIPGILAKYKKSSDLHDSLKIFRHLKYGPAKNSKKGTPFGSQKVCVGSIFGKSRFHSEKLNTITDLLIQQKSGFFMPFTLNFRMKMGKKSHVSSIFLGSVEIFQN